MDPNKVRAAVIKETRRGILQLLKVNYPGLLSFLSLRYLLPDVDQDHLRKDVAYLCDKGYVRRLDPQVNERWDDRAFKLTSDGVEVADRIEVDPALEP